MLIGMLALIGCATITRGVEEVFVVESNPVGAKVTLIYDEPVILSVEENQASPQGGTWALMQPTRNTSP